ncbi:MAG: lysophospholipid acyltransferase family protein [Pseudomonadota bacterium]
MKQFTYSALIVLSGLFGDWIFSLISRTIAAGYFVFFPARAAMGARFYRALFPEQSSLYHIWCTWRQYQNFTTVFTDRIRLRNRTDIGFSSRGWEAFETELDKGKGAIILMSHMGNWDLAASLLPRLGRNFKLLLYMGARAKEEIESVQKSDLQGQGIRIIAVEPSGGSPLYVVEGIHFLRSGGVVSLTGDKLWSPDQRFIPVPFLGHTAFLPEFPHVFALVSGAPLFVFFTFRTGPDQYRFELSAPLRVTCSSRSGRSQAIRESALAYSRMLEDTLRRHPHEWYHFEPFLHTGPR